MEFITVEYVAKLKGCSLQYIQKLIKDGKLESKMELNEKNRPKYLISVSALPEPLQKKYYGKLTADAQLCLPKVQETAVPQKLKHTKPAVKKEFGEFNADEREQITFWTDLLREWQIRRREYENCSEGDTVFIAETKRLRRAYLAEHGITLSRDILYRKYKAYRDGDLQGLVDGRGGWNKLSMATLFCDPPQNFVVGNPNGGDILSTMIQGVKEYIAACSLLKEIPLKARHVDWTSGDANNYGIMFDSDSLVKPFISGGGKREYNFTLFVRKFAKEDVDRLENSEFVERLQDWCGKQNAAKNFPAMPKGCTPTKLSAANGSLFERDKTGNTGLYQIQFKLSYIKKGS